jgi:flavin reductase (DIM6/NTAB) family NADH-FMN oxidoreductase RutF
MEELNRFVSIGATTFLAPISTVLVGCAGSDGWTRGEGAPNLMTVAWVGVCCSKPPMLGISVRPERHSHALIERTGEFTVNLVDQPLCRAMDYCGVKSGRDVNKFDALGLHAITAAPLTCAPALAEAPAYLCCKVRQTISLGSHDLFLAEIVEVCVRRTFVRQDGGVDEHAMDLVAFVHGKYRALGPELGFFGYSVASKEALRRRMPSVDSGKPHKPQKRGVKP